MPNNSYPIAMHVASFSKQETNGGQILCTFWRHLLFVWRPVQPYQVSWLCPGFLEAMECRHMCTYLGPRARKRRGGPGESSLPLLGCSFDAEERVSCDMQPFGWFECHHLVVFSPHRPSPSKRPPMLRAAGFEDRWLVPCVFSQ